MRAGLLMMAAILASSPALAAERASASPARRAALALFQRDWVLMNWALRFYDIDRDILLSPAEAAVAAQDFRKMADADRDGRITTAEYRAARQMILTRY